MQWLVVKTYMYTSLYLHQFDVSYNADLFGNGLTAHPDECVSVKRTRKLLYLETCSRRRGRHALLRGVN